MVVDQLGWIAYPFLLSVSVGVWPAFIFYLIDAVSHGKAVMMLHQRTVEFHGLPKHLCTYETMDNFCKQQGLAVSSIKIPPLRRGMTEMALRSRVVEVSLQSF